MFPVAAPTRSRAVTGFVGECRDGVCCGTVTSEVEREQSPSCPPCDLPVPTRNSKSANRGQLGKGTELHEEVLSSGQCFRTAALDSNGLVAQTHREDESVKFRGPTDP